MQELVLIQPVRTLQEESVGEAERLDFHEEFEARLVECGPLAYRVAQGVLRNTADAEDVAQEALLCAYRKFERLRDPSRFRAWLVRIVYRLALDRLRSAKRRELRETSSASPGQRPAVPTVEELAAATEFSGRLGRAMEKLPEKRGLVVVLTAG